MQEQFAHLAVEFFADKRLNKVKTKEAGTLIYDDVEKVKIRAAGDPKTVFVGLAHDQSSFRDPITNERLTYAQLHSGAYEAFQKGEKMRSSGTPLEMADFITPARAETLKGFHVYTVQQLAELDGTNLTRLGMDARALKNLAIQYLENAKKAVSGQALVQENADLKARLEALEAQIGKGSQGPVSEVANPVSPFADWDAETLIAYIEEQGGKVDKRWGLDRLIQEADALNEQLKKAS